MKYKFPLACLLMGLLFPRVEAATDFYVNDSVVIAPPDIPPQVTLTQTSGTTAQITGVPPASGVFDFVVRITDSAARVVTRPYSITINP